ncbi:hypothetical protein AVEN_95004-1, partial [Araneus ventricosus]
MPAHVSSSLSNRGSKLRGPFQNYTHSVVSKRDVNITELSKDIELATSLSTWSLVTTFMAIAVSVTWSMISVTTCYHIAWSLIDRDKEMLPWTRRYTNCIPRDNRIPAAIPNTRSEHAVG